MISSSFHFLRPVAALLAGVVAGGTPLGLAATLELPPIPNNEADAVVRLTWGSPAGVGIPPENSFFDIEIQGAGGEYESPTPPIPPGHYAAWCMDATTPIHPAASGSIYGGYLFSTAQWGFNAYLPNHPGVIQTDPIVWKRVNYLINHRTQTSTGVVPTMWEVQHAILGLMGQSAPTEDGYPTVRDFVVNQLEVDATNGVAGGWDLGPTDKVAVIFNIDINWDNLTPPEVQVLFLEVPLAPTAAIGDYVWLDSNFNGRQDAGEPGIPGVTVELYRTADNALMGTTTTDANGKYLFAGREPDTYYVKVIVPPGYIVTTQNAPGTTAQDDSDVNPLGVMASTTLSPGETDLTWDAGLYPADAWVTVGDFVWNDLNGNGIQDAGEPGIAGVTLTLTGTTVGGVSVSHTTTTDANGNYLFTEHPGTYTVTITPPAGYIATSTGQGTPATDSNPNPSGTTPMLLLAGGSDLTLDFGYYQPVTIGDFVWEDKNGNGIQDAGEPGIPGVTLTLIGTTVGGTTISETKTTDASGHYGFTEPPGTYEVIVSPPSGYVATATGKGTLATDSNASPSGTAPATLPGGSSDLTIDFGFWRPASLGDFVWLDLNLNGIQDAGEPGIEGVAVTLLGGGPDGVLGTGDDTTATTNTDGSGKYHFTGLVPGTPYQVTFAKPLGFAFTIVDAFGNSQDAADSDANPVTGQAPIVVLAPGEDNLTIDAGVVDLTPGIKIIKDANATFVAPNVPVTFTYSVFNVGSVPIANVVVTDDNATPNTADDFTPAPIVSSYNGHDYNVGDLNHDDLLDVTEIWKYSATVIPALQMTVTYNGTTYESGTLSYKMLANGDVRVFYRQSTAINDNTYGTGAAPDWPNGHKFGDLVGSDHAGFDVRYSDGSQLAKFYMDYISASGTPTATYSGYQSLGLSGDGSLLAGTGSFLKDFDSTLELDLNRAGYAGMIVNSPVGDPNWDVVDGYYFTISASAFTGGKSFGGATIFDQHNSPSKLGVNSLIPSIKGGASVNTATVVGKSGSTTVTDSDDAAISIITGPLGSLGDRVWFDANANGIQDSGEPGIAGVKLTVTCDLDKDGTVDYMATTTTDANGNYHFGGLPPGAYHVIVDTSTLPANYIPTYDLDGVTTPDIAIGELASGENRTDFDFGYVGSAPGLEFLKSANKTQAAFGEPVVYTYDLVNQGTVPLTNVVVHDDNGTPKDPNDDFTPTYVSGDLSNPGVLDPGEHWVYTATVTPPIELTGTVNGQTVVAGMLTSQVLTSGDIRISYRQSTGVNDNTYGTGAAADWPNGHKFGDLTGSDHVGFELKDANGQTVLKFYMDYLTAAATQDPYDSYPAYSGYRSLGVTGGDGSMLIGSATNLYDFDSTLELDLNRPGYTAVIVNSPVGDPNWDVVDGYAFTVKASAFGTAGFGSASIFDQHNSPSKLGVNSFVPVATGGEVTNQAIVTAQMNGSTVVALSDATVVVGQSGGTDGAAKLFVADIGVDKVFDYSSSSAGVGSFKLQAGNSDPRDIAAAADGSKLWVLDKDKNVNMYLPDGTAKGFWKADGLGKEPQGIAIDTADIWMADQSRKIYWFKGAVGNAAGITDKPEKTLAPPMTGNLKGIVTDGTSLWVVTEGGTDYVYRFTIVRDGSGTPTGLTQTGLWKLAAANAKPTGITLDPSGASMSLWIVDEGSDSVYEYANGRAQTSGTGTVVNSFHLSATDVAAQGIARIP